VFLSDFSDVNIITLILLIAGADWGDIITSHDAATINEPGVYHHEWRLA